MRYQPLRITAYLQAPVICDDRLPLDGAITYFLARESLGYQPSTGAYVNLSTFKGGPKLFDKRYQNVRGENFQFPACSFACWVGTVAEGRDYWVKRFDSKLSDIVDFRGRRGNIVTANGKYKGYRMPVYTRHAVAVRWYAVGDRVEIERTLLHCTHLGKKCSQGYGSILKWTIESFTADYSMRGPSGQLMRAVPSEEGLLAGFRPSYWSPENQTICRLPSTLREPL